MSSQSLQSSQTRLTWFGSIKKTSARTLQRLRPISMLNIINQLASHHCEQKMPLTLHITLIEEINGAQSISMNIVMLTINVPAWLSLLVLSLSLPLNEINKESVESSQHFVRLSCCSHWYLIWQQHSQSCWEQESREWSLWADFRWFSALYMQSAVK